MKQTTEERRERDRAYRKEKRAAARLSRPFVAIDGEGVTDANGRHSYVLLCNSLGDSLYKPDGITFPDVAAFLANIRTQCPNAILVGFGLNYDCNMWLYSLGLDFIVNRIFDRNPEEDNGYTYINGLGYVWMDWKPGKTFMLKVGKKPGLTVYDVFGWFQCPFARALLDYGIGDPDKIAIIEWMKERRNDFRSLDPEVMRDYCLTECEYLAALMDRLRDLTEGLGYGLARWDGVGALATAMLQGAGVKAHIWPAGRALPPEVLAAFHGGRFEAFQLGEFADLYAHDLHSAYGSAMLSLPCLAGASFRDVPPGQWQGGTALLRVRWDCPEDCALGPFPYRGAGDRICYPLDGEGWYWSVEVEAARRRYPYAVTILDVKALETAPCPCGGKPFGFVQTVYNRRRELKAAGDMRERPLKLGIAAIYGKLAQGVGHPAYQCFIWAGLITATVRARLWDAVTASGREAEREIVLMATDGIYSRVPLAVEGGPDMGQWDTGMVTEVFVAGSGLLRMKCNQHQEPACEHCHDTGYITKRRGFGRGERIPWEALIDAFRSHNTSAQVHVPLRRFIGAQLARHLPDRERWCTWLEGREESAVDVLLSGAPKRMDFSLLKVAAPGRIPAGSPDGFRLVTLPLPAPGDEPSRPHKVKNLRVALDNEEDLSRLIDMELSTD